MKKSSTFGSALLMLAVLVVAALGQGCTSQRQFDSPDAAVSSLVQTLRANDQAELKQILGSDAGEILSSGDEVADGQGRQSFLTAYDQKHQIVAADKGMALTVGANDWPLPIPIVKGGLMGKWTFDTAAGKDEILNRRVGRNESETIQVCQAIVDAQREYSAQFSAAGGAPVYARKFISDAGMKNGLYWETAPGEPASPLGPMVGHAQEEGYPAPSVASTSRAFHGYHFRMLTSRGANAPGGACSYLSGDKLVGGFGVVAYPVEYGNSGVMTFIVSETGIVYERDLGNDTAKLAREMQAFDPAPGWQVVQLTAPAP